MRVRDLTKLLDVTGVGSGHAACRKPGRFAIACWYEQKGGGIAQEDSCIANSAEGPGEDLPAVLGFASMQDKRSLIPFENGKEKYNSWRGHVHCESEQTGQRYQAREDTVRPPCHSVLGVLDHLAVDESLLRHSRSLVARRNPRGHPRSNPRQQTTDL